MYSSLPSLKANPMEGHSSNENRFQMNWDSKILLNCPTPREVTPIIRQLFHCRRDGLIIERLLFNMYLGL
jgi:hypothetical protein